MLRKYNFIIFTLVFCLLFGLAFFIGYTRNDPAVEAGLTSSDSAYSQSEAAQPSGGCGCSTCNCTNQ